jgi:hypothetical protein
MSAIVLISVLVLPIVYLFGLPQYNCELIGSLGFGLAAVTALVLLFLPKMLTVYAPAISTKSGKVAAVDTALKISSKKNFGANDEEMHDGNRMLQDCEQLLKGKSHEQQLMICQQHMNGWQALLMRQQAHAMDSSESHSQSHSHGSSHPSALASASATGGVRDSCYEMVSQDQLVLKQLQADMEKYPERELFAADRRSMFVMTSSTAAQDLQMLDA